ncbi:PREDICTED: uncharacterized protein LOC105558916 [Vollenhovia emeryi]|uniref:uncharacterized protein LOC105558916 n=1 Tax=Vollenhovia emeryi TaxID=411798 RepID=UPI0005F39966|nr:PREDICTED: uncharacterized protein LOC105558916 [Vollenhovia emeryi]XP_011862244.1 PREDICTED: uncharacterized protein LOC105558916 [Vollenhovia emeryi]
MLEIFQGGKDGKCSLRTVCRKLSDETCDREKPLDGRLRNRCLGGGIVNRRRYRRRTAKNKVTSSERIGRARGHPQPLTQFGCGSSINVTGTNRHLVAFYALYPAAHPTGAQRYSVRPPTSATRVFSALLERSQMRRRRRSARDVAGNDSEEGNSSRINRDRGHVRVHRKNTRGDAKERDSIKPRRRSVESTRSERSRRQSAERPRGQEITRGREGV